MVLAIMEEAGSVNTPILYGSYLPYPVFPRIASTSRNYAMTVFRELLQLKNLSPLWNNVYVANLAQPSVRT
jgi:hypothetical protein